ncbi:MAG: hypothetical protein HY718_04980 [Planctomycetes bacterium]|nr:hypothetical protein [Planctomycetota bacterium]
MNVNVSAAGSARAEIRDVTNRPISGRRLQDCDPIMANNVRHTVTWQGDPDVSNLGGQPVRLHLWMRSAKLYSFQFVGAKAGK